MISRPNNNPERSQHDAKTGRHGGHSWMMITCCIPMLLIAVALVAIGAASPGFLLVALACTAMMALMMWGMDHGANPPRNDTDETHSGHGR